MLNIRIDRNVETIAQLVVSEPSGTQATVNVNPQIVAANRVRGSFAESQAVLRSGANSGFSTGDNPVFDTGTRKKFPTGDNPVFDTGTRKKFPTGDNPVFDTGDNPVFDTGDNGSAAAPIIININV